MLWLTNWSHELNFSYGITDRFQFSSQIPYNRETRYFASEIILPGYDTSQIQYSSLKGNGLGNISISICYQILKEELRKPSLMAKLFILIPTGRKNPANIVNNQKYDLPPGNGETRMDFNLQLRKIFYPYSARINICYSYFFKAKKIFVPGEEEISFKSGNIFYIDISYNMHLNDWIVLSNEVAFQKWLDDKYFGETTRDQGISGRWGINYQPALVFQIRRFRFSEAIQFPLYGKNFFGADPVYTLGLQYII